MFWAMAVLTALCPPLRIIFKVSALFYSSIGAEAQVIKKRDILGRWEEVIVVERPLKWVYFLCLQERLSPSGVLRRTCIYSLPVQILMAQFLNCLVLWVIILRKISVIYGITAFRKKRPVKSHGWWWEFPVLFLDDPSPAVVTPGSSGHDY